MVVVNTSAQKAYPVFVGVAREKIILVKSGGVAIITSAYTYKIQRISFTERGKSR